MPCLAAPRTSIHHEPCERRLETIKISPETLRKAPPEIEKRLQAHSIRREMLYSREVWETNPKDNPW